MGMTEKLRERIASERMQRQIMIGELENEVAHLEAGLADSGYNFPDSLCVSFLRVTNLAGRRLCEIKLVDRLRWIR